MSWDEDDEPQPTRGRWFAAVLAFICLLVAAAVLACALVVKAIVENTA